MQANPCSVYVLQPMAWGAVIDVSAMVDLRKHGRRGSVQRRSSSNDSANRTTSDDGDGQIHSWLHDALPASARPPFGGALFIFERLLRRGLSGRLQD
jgi:hypothetical protein